MIEGRDLVKRYGSTTAVVGGHSYRDLPAPMREAGALLDAKAQAAELAARCREAGATVTDAGTNPDVIEITGLDSAEVGKLAAAHGVVLFELIPVRASLEEAFMELTRDSVEYQSAGVTR
jgi:ABC-2 type transport system ATP-binding protein